VETALVLPTGSTRRIHRVVTCGFRLRYEPSAQIAERHGWPVQRIEGGHFQLLADPIGVGDSLIRLTEAILSR
jgi:hypothetical protein